MSELHSKYSQFIVILIKRFIPLKYYAFFLISDVLFLLGAEVQPKTLTATVVTVDK